jgi:hypothetical protein
MTETTGIDTRHDEFADMLDGMTVKELVKYASLTYGLSVTAKYSKPDLINAIKSAASKFKMNERIRVGEDLKAEELPPGQAEIQIHRTELNKGMKSCIVGLNGKFASLPIGSQPFWCPLELVEILKNARRVEYDQDWSENPPLLIEREVNSYPYTIHRVSPHTEASFALANKKRGLKGRAPGESVRRRQERAADNR